jgi:hypothetical protein
VELESDDEDISVSPTPSSASNPTPKHAREVQQEKGSVGQKPAAPLRAQSESPAKGKTGELKPAQPSANAGAEKGEIPIEPQLKGSGVGSVQPRVRINDKVGFYYFVSSGYLAPHPESLHPVAKVVGGFDSSMNFSVPKKTYLELSSSRESVKPDDLLVIYRTVLPVVESHSGSMGYQVENLAIVKVLEVQKMRFLVEAKETFRPFEAGDLALPYETEIKRWKQAQVKKELPSHPLKCFVAGGAFNRENYNQMDFIFLSAGAKKGVVEGQTFEIRELKDAGLAEEGFHLPVGTAQVIYAGPNSSTAQILRNNEPIRKSFEAIYQP